MRRYTNRKLFSLVLPITAILIVGAALTRNHIATGQSSVPPTLHDRAAQAGRNFMVYSKVSFLDVYPDVASLAGESPVVIIGTPMSNRSRLSPDGRNVTTEYQVLVQQVFKGLDVTISSGAVPLPNPPPRSASNPNSAVPVVVGSNLRPGSTITVKRPGGKVAFPDGLTAEVKTLFDGKHMRNKGTYVLFLDQKGYDFTTIGGSQGVFEIPADCTGIMPADHWLNDPVVKKYKGMTVGAFLAEVSVVTGNQNLPWEPPPILQSPSKSNINQVLPIPCTNGNGLPKPSPIIQSKP